MAVNRRVNLFELELVAPPASGATQSTDIDIEDALKEVGKLRYDLTNYSLPSNRYYYRPGRRARYGFDFKKEGNFYVGIIGRNDLDGGQTERAGVITDLNLGSDAGLHYATHFLIDPKKRRILLESNSIGPRSGDVSRYLQDRLGSVLAGGVERCQLKPLIDEDAVRRFENEMGQLAGLEIGVLRENIGRLAAAKAAGLASEVVVIQNSMQQIAKSDKNIEMVTFQLQRRRYARTGGLSDAWKKATAWLARNSQEHIQRLKVRVEAGNDGATGTELVDLLSERTGRLISGIPTRTNRNIIVSAEMHARMLAVYDSM